MATLCDIATYFQNVNNQISFALDCVGIPLIVFIEAITSGKVFTLISNSRRWYIVAKDPGFNLNIALNSGIEPLARQELNEKLSNSLSELFVGTINNFGNMIQFKKDFGSFEAVFEIHLDPSGDLDQSELEDADESNDMYDSFIILADVNNLKLSRIKTTLNEVQTFILQVLIEKIKTRMVVNPELRKEDIAIQFKEPPKIIQSLRGFDIKEIRGNYEHYTVKAYDNKLVISGVIDENTIEKIDGLIRANLDY